MEGLQHVQARIALAASGGDRGRAAQAGAVEAVMLRRREKALLDKLRAQAASWRSSAAGLQREVNQGIALRQSIESKEARIAVMEVHAEQLEQLIKEHING
jgi:hypothetical protein